MSAPRHRIVFLAIAVLAVLPIGRSASASTFTVVNTNDSGAGSLRQAITDANTNGNPAIQDAVDFSIPGDGPHEILLSTALPPITEPVRIDGYTEGDETPGVPSDDARENDEPSGSSNAVLKIVLRSNGASGTVIDIDAPDVTVRGLVIRNFSGTPLNIGGARAVIEGNFIGTDVTGKVRQANVSGISLDCPVPGTRIGGTSPGARNIVTSNFSAITVFSDCRKIKIQGNLLGVGADGTTDIGNLQRGVEAGFVKNARILISGNVIAFNDGSGFSVAGAAGEDIGGYRFVGNSVFGNGTLGIDLNNDGVTQNDGRDRDRGTNGLQNFPVLTSATTTNGTTKVTGKLNSTPHTKFLVQLFSNDAVDPSGFGEGKTFLGQVSVTTDARGKATFSKRVPAPPAGEVHITSTATDARAWNTSEFSQALTIV